MKTDASHTKKLTALLKSLKKKYKVTEPPAMDPIGQLIFSMLEWNATTKQAEKAYGQLMEQVVDFNDLRVSPNNVLVDIIGKDYPHAEERIERLHEAMQDVFIREYGVHLESLKGKPKKEIKTYLESLRGLPYYSAASVLLLSFGGHAIPVDDKLGLLLTDEGCVPEGLTIEEVAAFLERSIKAADGILTHMQLRAWSDSKRRKVETVAMGLTDQVMASAKASEKGFAAAVVRRQKIAARVKKAEAKAQALEDADEASDALAGAEADVATEQAAGTDSGKNSKKKPAKSSTSKTTKKKPTKNIRRKK